MTIDYMAGRRGGPGFAQNRQFKAGQGHAGLYYERYGTKWISDTKKPEQGDRVDKKSWIKQVTAVALGESTALQRYGARIDALVRVRGGATGIFETTAPFVTGLGMSSPVENGLAWHRTLGVLYLPGSSVKGMVRSFATVWAEAHNAPAGEPDTIRRIFGPQPERDDEKAASGSVIFLDAVPTGPVQLEADIMTPHFSEYYQGGEADDLPNERKNPVPIEFVSLPRGIALRFGVLPADSFLLWEPSQEGDPLDQAMEDCRLAIQWISRALMVIGAGAKTKSGYGRFADGGWSRMF